MKQSDPCHVQESFRKDGPTFGTRSCPRFCATCSRSSNRCQSREIALGRCSTGAHRRRSNPFSASSGCRGARCRSLSLRADACSTKARCIRPCSAGNRAGRDGWSVVARARIGELLITGIRTEQCWRHDPARPSDLGFGVRYVSDATPDLPRCRPPRTRGVGAGKNSRAQPAGARRALRAGGVDRGCRWREAPGGARRSEPARGS